MKNKHNFYVSPTTIDSFLWYEKMGKPEDKFNELINKINKVPIEYPESAKKGVAMEDVVNLNISGQKIYNKDGFKFDPVLVDKIANKLKNNIGTQKWIEKIVPFKHGLFRVGGFLDYDYKDISVDLKTTGRYSLGKFKDNQQHRAYGLIEPHKKEFTYLVTDFENMYIEPYKNKTEYHDEFIHNVEGFWEFVQENKNIITDTRIFGN